MNSRSEIRRLAVQNPDALVEEIERLRAENDSLRVSAHNYTVAAKENERLQADLFRDRANAAGLRKALDRITATAGHPDAAEGCRLILGIARAALAGARDDGGGGKA